MNKTTLHCFLLLQLTFFSINALAISPKELLASQQESDSTKTSQEQSEESAKTSDASQKTETKIKLPINLQNQQQSDIEHYLPEKDINKILVGPNEHITLLSQSETTNSKGILVLIPEWQQSAISPSAIDNLRQVMPAQGWTTITVHPLAKPSNFPSHAISKQAKMEADNKAIEVYRESLTSLMKAVDEQTKMYPGIIVVVAQGQSGAQLLELYEKEAISAPAALVLLSVFMPEQHWQKQAADSLANLGFPVLDVSLARDNRYMPSSKKIRKVTVKRMAKSQYRAIEIKNHQAGVYPDNTLDREIKGWLTANGW